jgi:aminoglycoside/choline kinase family phosphotransferase
VPGDWFFMEGEAALRDQVKKAAGQKASEGPVVRLKGDASNRSYYRIGQPPDSHVLMVVPPDALAKSEEVSKGAAPGELPFLNVQRYLKQLGVRVPEILRYDPNAGVLVLEDLGDLTLERALQEGGDREKLYSTAVDLLARLRAAAERNQDQRCLAFSRAFDEDLYDWELHHFREWGMEAWSGRKGPAAEQAKLSAIFRRFSSQLAAEPRGFTHRDYQSRNLMLKGGEMVTIDFQDALLGPRQYDLVSLLRDSYVELDWPFVGRMVDRYVEVFERESGESIPALPFKQFFDLLTVQRKLKDAARFEYIHRVKGNPDFLISIPASLRYAASALKRLPELADLREIASRYVPALA